MFPLDCQSGDPIVTSKSIDKAGKDMARSPDAHVNLLGVRVAGGLPACILRLYLTNNQSTVIVSNFPGPSKNISIWGCKLVDSMFCFPSVVNAGD